MFLPMAPVCPLESILHSTFWPLQWPVRTMSRESWKESAPPWRK